MHRRAAPSLKVAASREARARRGNKLNNGGGIRNGNGLLPHHTKRNSYGKGKGSSSSGRVVLLIAIGTIFVCLLLVWGGALYHVSSNADGEGEGKAKWKLGNPKNAIRRIRNGVTKYHSVPTNSDGNPYTSEALAKNPYLGWQPPMVPSPLGSAFSWRECFKADAKSDGSDQPGMWCLH